MLDLQRLTTTLWRGLLIALSCLALRLLAIWIYRLTFHPLAKYPGPWLAKVSDLYGAYHNARGQLHIETEKGHRRWGPLIRQGPDKLVFNSATALHDVYSSNEVQKSYGYTTMIPAPGAYNIFTAVDKGIHKHKRKVLSQGFSDQCVRAFEPKILDHIDIFLAKLVGSPERGSGDGEWSTPANMTDRCRHLGYDIMGEFGFGQSFELQLKDANRFLIEAVTATTNKAGVYVQYPALANLKLEKLLYQRGLGMREKYLQLMSDLVRSRISKEKDAKNDLLYFLADAKDPETGLGFTEDEIWAESRFLLIAGADTTSTALTTAFFYLSAYPACYEKLAYEIRNTFSSGSEIRSGPKLAQCQYLRACIDESLRMSPPISGTLWREVCAGGHVIDNEYVPAGYDVGVNPYAVHHNEDCFPDSFTFKPERWIPSADNPEKDIERARRAFSVYSIGSRACAGRNMAYTELGDSIARTMWYSDFRRPEGPLGVVGAGAEGSREGRHRVKEFQLMEHLTCSHDGPFLQFCGRKGLTDELFHDRRAPPASF